MTKIHSVALRYFKSDKAPVVLNYRQVAPGHRQARLAGREGLVPEIALDQYSCKAVIDWIEIDLQLSRITQQQWLADAIAGFGRRPFIKPIGPGEGKESSRFQVKFQEPDFPKLRRILAAIDRKHGIVSEPVVIGMEVSVDFTPRAPSDEARARMMGVLARQLAPSLDVFAAQAGMPRHSWGRGHRWARIQKVPLGRDPYSFAVNDITSSPVADTTTYFGADDSDDMVRVMDKVVDRQNTFAGTSDVLAAKDQRCRVEVTLRQGKLEELGVRHINDVARFKFAALQGSYFQFKLATVRSLSGSEGPVAAYQERQRVQKFLLTGISGLAKMDLTLLEHDTVKRPVVRRALAKLGRTLPGRPRTGPGAYGTAFAYEGLCKTVQTALSNLSRKLRGERGEEEA